MSEDGAGGTEESGSTRLSQCEWNSLAWEEDTRELAAREEFSARLPRAGSFLLKVKASAHFAYSACAL